MLRGRRYARVEPISLRKAIVAIIIAVSALAMFSSTRAQDPREMLVSLIQLIANPTAFDQKRVLVMGYVTLEFENQHIYLSEADAKHGITRNSLWLDVSDATYANRARFHQRYVLVEGTFNARRRGHLGLSSGEIRNIGRLDLLN
jgi:hypothetical protein